MDLTRHEQQRYARHISLPEVGMAGQLRLKNARVLIVGAGGLGSPVALYLAAAGVGHIGIIDDDVVDLTNLQRQIIHTDAAIGQPKVASAQAGMQGINPCIDITTYGYRLTAANVLGLVTLYDVVVDATDSFATRYIVNDACVILQKPMVYGAIFRFEGQVSVFAPHLGGPCYRCLFPDPPPAELAPNCAEAGVFGVLPGVVGSVQATEALKAILGIGLSLCGRLWLYDALTMQVDTWQIAPNPACPRCGTNPILNGIIAVDALCTPLLNADEWSPIQLQERLAQSPAPFVLDVREPHEFALSHLAGAVRIGVNEVATRVDELRTVGSIIVYCRSGMRSARARELLRQHGLTAVSLAGGLLAWRRDIAPQMPVA